ncbi:MAG TPA: PaaI family thioesterase [Limnochordia bacterium]
MALRDDRIAWESRAAPTRRFHSDGCFVCGQANPAGFRAPVWTDERFAWIEAVVPEPLRGFAEITHGGAIAALLDEAMWYAIYAQGKATLTVSLEIRLRKPVVPGSTVIAEALGLGRRGRFYLGRARVRDERGEVVATAAGEFLEAPGRFGHLTGMLVEQRLQSSGSGDP